jgi:hypothetical protein
MRVGKPQQKPASGLVAAKTSQVNINKAKAVPQRASNAQRIGTQKAVPASSAGPVMRATASKFTKAPAALAANTGKAKKQSG